MKTWVYKNLYINVHGNIIQNCQEADTTQMSLNRWKGKQKAVYSYKGILFRQKRTKYDACYNMDETENTLSESARHQKPLRRYTRCGFTA